MKRSIRRIGILQLVASFTFLGAAGMLLYNASSAVYSTEPSLPKGSWFQDDILSYVQFLGLVIMLWFSWLPLRCSIPPEELELLEAHDPSAADLDEYYVAVPSMLQNPSTSLGRTTAATSAITGNSPRHSASVTYVSTTSSASSGLSSSSAAGGSANQQKGGKHRPSSSRPVTITSASDDMNLASKHQHQHQQQQQPLLPNASPVQTVRVGSTPSRTPASSSSSSSSTLSSSRSGASLRVPPKTSHDDDNGGFDVALDPGNSSD